MNKQEFDLIIKEEQREESTLPQKEKDLHKTKYETGFLESTPRSGNTSPREMEPKVLRVITNYLYYNPNQNDITQYQNPDFFKLVFPRKLFLIFSSLSF